MLAPVAFGGGGRDGPGCYASGVGATFLIPLTLLSTLRWGPIQSKEVTCHYLNPTRPLDGSDRWKIFSQKSTFSTSGNLRWSSESQGGGGWPSWMMVMALRAAPCGLRSKWPRVSVSGTLLCSVELFFLSGIHLRSQICLALSPTWRAKQITA